MKKKLIFILAIMILLLVSHTTQGTVSDTDLQFWYTFDDSDTDGTNVQDLVSGWNATNDAGVITGIDSTIANLDEEHEYGDAENAKTGDRAQLDIITDFTFGMWIRKNTSAEPDMLFFHGASEYYQAYKESDNDLQIDFKGGARCQIRITSANLNNLFDGSPNFLVIMHNSSGSTCDTSGANQNLFVYVNNVSLTIEDISITGAINDINPGSDLFIAASSDAGANDFKGNINEFFKYNRSLTRTEITELYDGGAGLQYPFTPGGDTPEPPSITITTNLTDYVNSTDNPYYFSVGVDATNVTDTNTWTVNVYYNNTLNQSFFTNENLNQTNIRINLSYGGQQLGYNINVSINNSNSGVPVSDSFEKLDIFLDSVIPTSILTNLENNTILYYGIDDIINVTLNGTDANLYALNMSLKNASNGYVFNNTFIENVNTTTYSINFTFDIDTLNNGSYEIETHIWDSHTDNLASNITWYWNNNILYASGVQFSGDDIKAINNKNVTVTYFYYVGDRNKMKVTFNDQSLNHEFNIYAPSWKYVGDKYGYLGHFVSMKYKRWMDFVGNNVKDIIVTGLGNNHYNIYVEHYTLTDEVEFESIGDLNELHEVYSFDISQGMTFEVTDAIANTSVSNFTVTVWNNSILWQNKTANGVNLTFNITDGYYLVNISHPDYVQNDTNVSFTVGGLHTEYLTAANSLYLFFYDEETDTLINNINVSIDVLGPTSANTYTTDTGSKFISGFDTGAYEIRYKGTGYRSRTYYTTISSSTTQSIDLYMVSNASSSLILFFIGDEKSSPIFNATLKAKRFFINDNAYLIVDMGKTDQNGETALYLVPNDVYYEFVAEKGGVVVFDGSPQKIFASNVYIRAPLTESEIRGLSIFTQSVTRNLSWNNNTKILSYRFNDASGNILNGCLKVLKTTLLAESIIGPVCSAGNSATLTINMSTHLQNDTSYTAIGTIETNTTNTAFSDVLTDFVRLNTPWDRFNKPGLFVSYIFIGTMFMAGLPFSFSIAVIYSILSMVVVQLLGFSYFGTGMIMVFSIIGFILAVRNKA